MWHKEIPAHGAPVSTTEPGWVNTTSWIGEKQDFPVSHSPELKPPNTASQRGG